MSNLFNFNDSNIEDSISDNYPNYLQLFRENKNYLNGKEIYRLRLPDVDCYDKSFFHMITKDYEENKKCVCPRTGMICEHPFEYNPWINNKFPREICPNRIIATVCLVDFFKQDLLVWEKVESKKGVKNRIICYSTRDDYVIVLERRNDGDIYLVTGYPVEFRHRKDMLMKQYNNYIRKNKTKFTFTTSS